MTPLAAQGTARPSGEPLAACRERVAILRDLLAILFEDPPSPELITVDNILERYRLTQFGAPAMAAIEQTQRVVRSRRSEGQVGLCEFHIGLIYLYFGDPRAAANQFAIARQQWMLEGDGAGIALAHYAQGAALRHAYHYEAAMAQYGRAERSLARVLYGAAAARLAALETALRLRLADERRTLRELMWPHDGPPGGVPNGAGAAEAPGMGPAGASATGPEAAPAGAAGPVVTEIDRPGMPLWHLPEPAVANRVSPVPGHDLTDGRYRWFTVYRRADAYLPEFTEGTWLLVDSRVELGVQDGRAMVVVAGRLADAGSVIVRPRPAPADALFYFLGYRVAALAEEAGDSLVLDDSGAAIHIPDAVVLGIVVGSWHNILG
jgi:hypothetical protein